MRIGCSSFSWDTIGVMTNSPDYIWHRTNLRNYGGVFYGEGERKLLNMRLTGFGEALGGGFGIPRRRGLSALQPSRRSR